MWHPRAVGVCAFGYITPQPEMRNLGETIAH